MQDVVCYRSMDPLLQRDIRISFLDLSCTFRCMCLAWLYASRANNLKRKLYFLHVQRQNFSDGGYAPQKFIYRAALSSLHFFLQNHTLHLQPPIQTSCLLSLILWPTHHPQGPTATSRYSHYPRSLPSSDLGQSQLQARQKIFRIRNGEARTGGPVLLLEQQK